MVCYCVCKYLTDSNQENTSDIVAEQGNLPVEKESEINIEEEEEEEEGEDGKYSYVLPLC